MATGPTADGVFIKEFNNQVKMGASADVRFASGGLKLEQMLITNWEFVSLVYPDWN